ncbi:MAG: aminotransferase class I/II-fold pyridoxal phosphate-dependent enzyme [Planctomycetes bacterium]|nr:aminotransferase class I/II-fold pyridoxal phosphate-dependent enzyme [Planctomycetota bacterium]
MKLRTSARPAAVLSRRTRPAGTHPNPGPASPAFPRARRLTRLPPYLFAEMDRRRRALLAAGHDVINLGIGDPDQPTPAFIRRAIAEAWKISGVHQYSPGEGTIEYRSAIAQWYRRVMDVEVDPRTEICAVIGSKEGIAHLPLALLEPGETVLVPEPGYPPYTSGAVFAGGRVHYMPLRRENGFLPDFEAIPSATLRRARILWLCSPNNPTGSVAPRAYLERLVAFARRRRILIGYDAAYYAIYAEERPCSILEIPGAKEVAIEFQSFSKTFHMTGWRIGWAAGRAEVVSALRDLKANLDSGPYMPIQHAAAEALRSGDAEAAKIRAMYRRRRDTAVAGLRRLGWEVTPPPATFYLWGPVPLRAGSTEFARRCLEEAHVVVTPGNGFGPSGEGYFRIALTVPEARLREAIVRLGKVKW